MNLEQLEILANRIIDENHTPSADELTGLLDFADGNLFDVIAHAHRITLAKLKEPYHLCGIVNAKSGLCTEDCAFCAQSARHKTGIETYDLFPGIGMPGYMTMQCNDYLPPPGLMVFPVSMYAW